MLSKEKIEIYKKLLESQREELMREIKDDEKPQDFGDDVDSFEEEANEAEAFSANIALGYTHRMRLENINVALSKIQEGRYGVCEKCGSEISEKVLDVAPESRLCESCKKKE